MGENAASRKCLHIDVDIRADGYKNIDEARDALRKFCDATGMPWPVAVSSGGGAHLYWTFTRDLTPEEWKPLAEALKRVCMRHDFHVDGACTGDIVCVLRPPLTINHKYDSSPMVMVDMRAQDYAPEDIAALLKADARKDGNGAAKPNGCNKPNDSAGQGGAAIIPFTDSPARPWAGWNRGRGIDASGVSKLLELFDIGQSRFASVENGPMDMRLGSLPMSSPGIWSQRGLTGLTMVKKMHKLNSLHCLL